MKQILLQFELFSFIDQSISQNMQKKGGNLFFEEIEK